MQPIKTTNAMNPAPAKGIESFPTPVIDDVVISEVVNSWKGDYQPLEYGVLWRDVSHAPNQGSFPEHKLVFQQPTSEDGQWVKRIWVNDRVNQDSYNYAIKYSAGSQEHPIYIRTYIVPRETYAPLLDGTPDPLFPGALLVDEEAVRNEGELDSKYITVTRVYETIPGPEVPTRRYNERGDLETVIVQTVPPNTPPTADGLLVTQSQVEQVETGKGVKTTATVQDHALLQIKEKKEGLLGETITTDDIVSPSTKPDALSQTIVASTVEQYTATKARKRTTTASGPTSLSQKSKDGKLLGDITLTESVVAPNASPDAVSSAILSSEVKQVDSGKAIKRNVVLNSTPTLSGKQAEQGLLGVKSTIESIVPAGTPEDPLSLSVISSAVEPIDSVRSRKVTVSSFGPITLSGGQKKDGLLGETNVSETIVAAGTQPDALTQSVVSSVVEPIDAAKSKKITITSTGPTSLVGKKINERGDVEIITESIVGLGQEPDGDSFLQSSSEVVPIDSSKSRKTTSLVSEYTQLGLKENGAGLLGKTVTTEEVVPVSTNPDALSQTVLSSSVQKISKTKAVKKTTTATGPRSLSGVENKEGLLGQTETTKSIVAANATADAVSLEVISSVVEPIDAAKSQKTTITSSGPTSLTGKNNKSGLLGTTVVTESIVAANSNPDALSISVVESQVEPIDSAKSKKTTVISSGPTSLTSRILADSPTGAVNATKTNFIVNPNQSPVNSLTTLKYDINAIDSAKSEAEVVQVNSWPQVRGIEFDDLTGLPIPYTEQVIEPSEYNGAWEPWGNTNYKPIDEYKSLKKSYSVSEIQQYYLGYLSEIGTPVKVSLPDKLIEVTAYIARDYSEGKNVSDSNNTSGDSYGYTSGGGFRSAGSISADIYFKIEKGFDGFIDGVEVTFFALPYVLGSGSMAGVIQERINVLSEIQKRLPNLDVKLWPTLKKISQNILVFTGGKSKTTSSSNSEDVSINGFASSERQDESYDIDTNVNSVTVPDALYESITIKEEKFGPIIPDDLQITGGVYPKTLPATNPAKFPVGNYLISSDASIYKFGLVKITAVIAKVTEDFV